MKIEVNIEKKYAFLIVGIILALGIGGYVYAFGGSAPATMGHSMGEIDWSQQIQGNVSVSGNLAVGGNLSLSGDVCANGKCLSNAGGVELGYAQTKTVAIIDASDDGGNGYDHRVNLPYNSTKIRAIILTVPYLYGATGYWPKNGTRYIFDGGSAGSTSGCPGGINSACNISNLPFNTDLLVFSHGSCVGGASLYLRVNVANASNPGNERTTPISIRAWGDGCDYGGVMPLQISYERYCPMYNGSCIDYYPL